MLPASLLSSPPTVICDASAPVYATSVVPAASACAGFSIGVLSSKNALRMVASAPEPVACPAPYAGCVGAPSGYACGRRYELGNFSPALPKYGARPPLLSEVVMLLC